MFRLVLDLRKAPIGGAACWVGRVKVQITGKAKAHGACKNVDQDGKAHRGNQATQIVGSGG